MFWTSGISKYRANCLLLRHELALFWKVLACSEKSWLYDLKSLGLLGSRKWHCTVISERRSFLSRVQLYHVTCAALQDFNSLFCAFNQMSAAIPKPGYTKRVAQNMHLCYDRASLNRSYVLNRFYKQVCVGAFCLHRYRPRYKMYNKNCLCNSNCICNWKFAGKT